MNTITDRILKRIHGLGPGAVFTPKDFLDVGSRAAVDQVLKRLVEAGSIQRIGRGLYHVPRINKTLGIPVPPAEDAIAQALSRQTGSRIAPSGAVAANQLGLSTQVPAQTVYVTDGRSRKVKVGQRMFHIRHMAARRFGRLDTPSGLVIHALQQLGSNGVDDRAIAILRRRLTPAQRRDLLKHARYAAAWIADIARRIADPMTGDAHG